MEPGTAKGEGAGRGDKGRQGEDVKSEGGKRKGQGDEHKYEENGE